MAAEGRLEMDLSLRKAERCLERVEHALIPGHYDVFVCDEALPGCAQFLLG